MTSMEIIKYPNELLRQKSQEVKLPLSNEDIALLNKMFKYVKEHKDTAVGISAIQLGIPKRLCAIRYIEGNYQFIYKLANPRIIKHSNKFLYNPEGCLSVEEEHDESVKRWDNVMVSGFDLITNKPVLINAYGYEATILQHEIDHMDGILYIDRLEKQNV